MKNVKRILAVVLCVCLVMAMSVVAFAAEARGTVMKCPNCNVGRVNTTVTRRYEHPEQSECRHGYNNGHDWYDVYHVIKRARCDSCSYSTESEYDDHVLKSCNGF